MGRKTTIYLNNKQIKMMDAIEAHYAKSLGDVRYAKLNVSLILLEGLELFCEKHNIDYKKGD